MIRLERSIVCKALGDGWLTFVVEMWQVIAGHAWAGYTRQW
jgi:hypothetical protein